MDADVRAEIARLERMIAQLMARHRQTLAFGRTTRAAQDAGPVQLLQVRQSALELHDGVTHLQAYGFASHPPPGSDTLTVYMGGDRATGVVVATGNQTLRMRGLAPGEAVIHDAWGRTIRLSASGIVIDGNGTAVTVIGDLHVSGDVISHYGTSGSVTLTHHQHAALSSAPTPGT